MQQRSDEQLVTLVLNGNTAAFAVLLERYQKQILALAFRLGGDYDEAQDMAQEAFLRIYRELPKYDAARRFFPWMYRVAHNTCVNILLKRPKDQTPLDFVSEIPEVAMVSATPARSFEEVERKDAITAALRALPTQYREPLVLKYLEGFSYQEIAEILDLPESTIETRLFRGRKALKELLSDYI